MVIQTVFYNGEKHITRTYRDVKRHRGLSELREGFLAQRDTYKWGKMIQLKGKERIIIAQFFNGDDEGRFDEGTTDWNEEGAEL